LATTTLERCLCDAHTFIRHEACLAIGTLGDDAAPFLPSLRLRLRDGNVQVSAWAAGTLLKLRHIDQDIDYGMEAQAALRSLLISNDSQSCREACWVIGQMDAKALELLPVLQDRLRDEQVRSCAIGAMLKQLLPTLLQKLHDRKHVIRQDAFRILRGFQDTDASAVLDHTTLSQLTCANITGDIWVSELDDPEVTGADVEEETTEKPILFPKPTNSLDERLASREKLVYLAACDIAMALEEPDEAVVKVLHVRLRDPAGRVRAMASVLLLKQLSLGAVVNEAAVHRAFQELLTSSRRADRLEACAAAQRLTVPAPSLVHDLSQCLRDENGIVRVRAAGALLQQSALGVEPIDCTAAELTLHNVLESDKVAFRQEVCVAITTLNTKASMLLLQDMTECLQDPDFGVRARAGVALVRQRDIGARVDVKTADDTLRKLLGHKDWEIRYSACDACRGVPEVARMLPALSDRLSDHKGAVQEVAKLALSC